jgi:hypothetical protein
MVNFNTIFRKITILLCKIETANLANRSSLGDGEYSELSLTLSFRKYHLFHVAFLNLHSVGLLYGGGELASQQVRRFR